MKVSVVTPVNNEEKILEENVRIISKYLDDNGIDFEHILVENGSTDNTLEIARKISARDSRIKVFQIPYRSLGMGLRTGFQNARGDFVVWYPIDMAIKIDYIKDSLRDIKDYDAVIASKDHPKTRLKRPFLRKLSSKIYNLLIRILFGIPFSDTQCVKTFRREPLQKILPEVKTNDINFEVELLYRAQKRGLKMIEYPVEIHDTRKSKVRPLDFIKTALKLFLLRLRV
ncbi:MAG: glycosyltransferase [Candidatus Altiarchaeales archaeon]|nr:glycosyltransferase [Candidatus Altiarchaeales archaeon]